MKTESNFFSNHVIGFYRSIDINANLPAGINVMNPYKDPVICDLSEKFYRKYYSDENPRTYIFGINPGRFGAGVTGITFTDPIRLETICGIPNSLEKKQELSSVFIYELISRYGGPEKFYSRFYMTAVCPLGFTKDGKNLNYYDDRQLELTIYDFIIGSIRRQLEFAANREYALCLGEGKNYNYFSDLNEKHHFFRKIIPLAHPRFILQYNLKKKDEYILQYLNALE